MEAIIQIFLIPLHNILQLILRTLRTHRAVPEGLSNLIVRDLCPGGILAVQTPPFAEMCTKFPVYWGLAELLLKTMKLFL